MFTPLETAAGAILLHLATATLLFDAGGILGISGLLRQLLRSPQLNLNRSTIWFFVGMALATSTTGIITPDLLPHYATLNWNPYLILKTLSTGLLTGWGTKHCGGCTSGHMLCGISRLSPRSFLATAIFFPVAVITFQITHPTLETAACSPHRPCYVVKMADSQKIGVVAGALVLAAGLLVSNRNIALGQANVNKTYAISGFTFGLGLLISGMANPTKVQSFFAVQFRPLDLHHWDPSLMLIIIFAIIPNIIQIRRRGMDKPPRLVKKFELPTKTLQDVDVKFILGAVAFGLAWGWSGTCPGPAVIRTIVQPAWGLLWMAGFYAGGLDTLG